MQPGVISAIHAYMADGAPHPDLDNLAASGLDLLPLLATGLREDLPIERTERLESILKAVLRHAFARPLSIPDALRIAAFQQSLGFILKYKSYAVKAASPLGYSIFLQNQREGFSFQNHIVHKLEVFHILGVTPGGYVFFCDAADWDRIYDPLAFSRWLQGEPNPLYDPYRYEPRPGDVFIISELGVVHTVLGCVLEEFATISTDMVVRLHDQNSGKPIPADFNRASVEAQLRSLAAPPASRLVTGYYPRSFQNIAPEPIPGGERMVLCDSFVRAARYRIGPGLESAASGDTARAASLRIFSGHGELCLGEGRERASLEFAPGDLFLIPPGIRYSLLNRTGGTLEFSEHVIAPDVAFAR